MMCPNLTQIKFKALIDGSLHCHNVLFVIPPYAGHMICGIKCPQHLMSTASHIHRLSIYIVITLLFKYCSMKIFYFKNFCSITSARLYLYTAYLVCSFSNRLNVSFINYFLCDNTDHTAKPHLVVSLHCCNVLSCIAWCLGGPCVRRSHDPWHHIICRILYLQTFPLVHYFSL